MELNYMMKLILPQSPQPEIWCSIWNCPKDKFNGMYHLMHEYLCEVELLMVWLAWRIKFSIIIDVRGFKNLICPALESLTYAHKHRRAKSIIVSMLPRHKQKMIWSKAIIMKEMEGNLEGQQYRVEFPRPSPRTKELKKDIQQSWKHREYLRVESL